MKKLLALLTAAVATLTSAWAATPVAVWEGDFSVNLTQNNHTLGLDGCETVDGGVKIVSAPFAITNATITTDNKTAYDHTIVMDVVLPEDDLSGALFTFGRSGNNTTYYDSDLIGVYLDNGETWGWWNKGKYNSAPVAKSTLTSGAHRIVYRYLSGGVGTRAPVMYVDGTKVYEANSGLRATIGARNINVGGISVDNGNLLTGMVIKKFALFIETTAQSDDQQYLTYVFPGETVTCTATIEGDTEYSALQWDTAPEAEKLANTKLVINGSGSVTGFTGAVHEISIAEGVTFDISEMTGGSLDGAGFVTSKYVPASIGSGLTLTINGPTSGESDALSVTVANAGTLKTTGKVALNGSSSGTLEVVSGTLTMAHAENSKAISGNVTIDQGATMVVSNTDSLNYDGSATIKVYGTLDLGSSRWSMGANNKLFVYGTGTVAGAGQVKDDVEQGALDYYTNDNHLVLVGNATVDATVRVRNTGHSLLLAQTRDSTVTFSGKIIGAGNVIKGAASNAEGGTGAAGNAFIEFSGENTFTGTFTHKSSCGTLRFMPGCSMAASSIITEPGSALSFGSAVAEGEVTIAGSVTYNNGSWANEPQVYVNTSIGGAFTSNKRVKVYGNKTLTLAEGSEIELTSDSTGTIDGTGTIKWPVAGNPGITVASTWTGIFSVKALSGSNLQMQKWINANSTLQTTGYTDGNAYINGGASFTFGTLELLEGGTFTLNNGNSNANYTFAKVCGSGTFDAMMTTHNNKTPGAMTFNITTLDANIAVNCNRTLKVTTVVTTLEEQPTAKTKVVSLGEGTTISNLDSTVFKLSDGETAIDLTSYNVTTEADGVYIAPAATEVTITIPEVTGTTVAVTVDGTTVDATSGSITAAPGATVVVTYTPSEINYVGGGTVTIEAAEGVTVETTGVTTPTLREAGTVYAKVNTLNGGFKKDGKDVTLLEGDVIAVKLGEFSGTQWQISLDKHAGYDYVFETKEGGDNRYSVVTDIPANTTVTISEGAKVFFYNSGAGATNKALADGVVIDGDGTLEIENIVTVNGAATISVNTITVTSTGSIKLADGATLTCAKLEEGDTITKVTTDVDGKHVEYKDGAYSLVVNKTATELFLEAINGDAAEVTLTGDVAIESMITLTKDFAITLNGHTLGLVAEGKALKLIEVIGGATLTIDGTVEGSTVAGRINIGKNTNNNGNLVVNGGTFDVGENTAIHVNGTCKDSSVSLTGVTITTGDNGIQLSGNGTHTITDCSITGLTAVYVKAGTVSISNSTLVATGAKSAVTTNNNGSDATGDALVLDNCVPPYPEIGTITIGEDVVFVSAHGSAVLSFAREGNTRQQKILPAALKTSGITEDVATEADLFDDYVEPSTDLPGAEEVPADQKDAYNTWAAENGVTESTTTDTKVLATAYAMGVTIGECASIEEAAQKAVEDEVPSIDMTALVDGDLTAAVAAINTKYNGKVEASLVEVTEGTLKSTETAKFFKLQITIKTTPTDN